MVLCVNSESTYEIALMGYESLIGHPERFEQIQHTHRTEWRTNFRAYWSARDSTDYRAVVATRLAHLPELHPMPYLPIPSGLFLLGMLALRQGVFVAPRQHIRLIGGAMIFGVVAWAGWYWLQRWYFPAHLHKPPFLSMLTAMLLRDIVNYTWLALTYIGMVLLLVAHNPAWLRRLSAFGITGRMALTNYLLQVMVLDVTFGKYGFGADVPMIVAPFAALALFGVDVALCRWWLSRFQYGPLEWLWRSATYARWEPMRRIEHQERLVTNSA